MFYFDLLRKTLSKTWPGELMSSLQEPLSGVPLQDIFDFYILLFGFTFLITLLCFKQHNFQIVKKSVTYEFSSRVVSTFPPSNKIKFTPINNSSLVHVRHKRFSTFPGFKSVRSLERFVSYDTQNNILRLLELDSIVVKVYGKSRNYWTGSFQHGPV